jgi:hypothetical protein
VKSEATQKINKIADVINQYGKFITNIIDGIAYRAAFCRYRAHVIREKRLTTSKSVQARSGCSQCIRCTWRFKGDGANKHNQNADSPRLPAGFSIASNKRLVEGSAILLRSH